MSEQSQAAAAAAAPPAAAVDSEPKYWVTWSDVKFPGTPEQRDRFKEWAKEQPTKPDPHDTSQWVQQNIDRNIYDSMNPFFDEVAYEIASERQQKCSPGATIQRPGYGLTLDAMPTSEDRFPIITGDNERDWKAATLIHREVCMLKVIEELTNKPEWWRKVNDAEIAKKWKDEALKMNWKKLNKFADFTPAMADACIKEIKLKAEMYEKTGLIPVMDYAACVLKSDKLIPDDLRTALNSAVARLEDVPEDRKDWHPGSDGLVLDLVHPSLWPLLYGRSRILPDKTTNLTDCLESCGKGDIISKPHPLESSVVNPSYPSRNGIPSLSSRFQWLPCDVVVDDAGNAKIDSYINNLHPVDHADIYPIIEKFITLALPAWDVVYRWPEEFAYQRLSTLELGFNCQVPGICGGWCDYRNRPLEEGEEPRSDDEDEEDDEEEEIEVEEEAAGGDENKIDIDEGEEEGDKEKEDEKEVANSEEEEKEADDGEDDEEEEEEGRNERDRRDKKWYIQTHPLRIPEPNPDTVLLGLTPSDIKSSSFFNNSRRLQVIVKLANIHLTPDKPHYKGGSWHVEGQLNEHIVSTALFYYDSDNITDCHLNFRTPADREHLSLNLGYQQSDFVSIRRMFPINVSGNTLQDIGGVLTRQGRALFFPNVYQHQVGSFSLADKSKPGHRKILALFLVDPAIPVISTANVPPQQKDWWTQAKTHQEGLEMASRLPPEIAKMVNDNVDFPIDEEEAKKIREELMAERTVLQQGTEGAMNAVEWNFCEH